MVHPLLGLFAATWLFAASHVCEALSQPTRRESGPRSSSVFSKDLEIPTLPCGNIESSYGPPIHVCYTNSPLSATSWLEDHIPSGDGVTVGFDVEVRRPISFVLSVDGEDEQ
jgi:hypothetical protein